MNEILSLRHDGIDYDWLDLRLASCYWKKVRDTSESSIVSREDAQFYDEDNGGGDGFASDNELEYGGSNGQEEHIYLSLSEIAACLSENEEKCSLSAEELMTKLVKSELWIESPVGYKPVDEVVDEISEYEC